MARRCRTHRASLARCLSRRRRRTAVAGAACRGCAGAAGRPRSHTAPGGGNRAVAIRGGTIFAANRDTSPVGRIDAATPEDALVTRAEFDVVVRHLPPGGAVFASSLMSGRPLGEAAARALDAAADFDIASNITGLIEAGAFTSFAFGDV